MITAGGKNITPSEIENSLKFSSFIKEAVIVADRRRFVSALIQIDFESVSKWATDENILFTNFKSLVENPTVFALIQKEVEKSNSHMPQVQQVRKFHLFTKELDHDDGEVTATMKVKRKSIYEKYTVEIESMYA
jgi:long-chain acyl-CoA synthetase